MEVSCGPVIGEGSLLLFMLFLLFYFQAVNVPNLTQPSPSDWQEHMAADGRR